MYERRVAESYSPSSCNALCFVSLMFSKIYLGLNLFWCSQLCSFVKSYKLNLVPLFDYSKAKELMHTDGIMILIIY